MKDFMVYDGHFWINIEKILTKERKKELMEDVENTDKLLLVKDEMWARIETPHPTKKQKIAHKAPWRPEDINAVGSLKKVPKIKE